MMSVSGKYELTNNIQRTKMVGINCNLSAQVIVTAYITFALYTVLFLTDQPIRVISLCHLRVLIQPPLRRAAFIATEIKGDPGQSITNAAEELATQLVAAFNMEPDQARFIEHYTPASYEGSHDTSYDEVTFTWQGKQARNPQWRRLQPHEIADLQDFE